MAPWGVIQHVDFEGPGLIAAAARARGIALDVRRMHRGDPLPELAEIDGLIVMGGPMGVTDTNEHPYLGPERRLLATAVREARPVLGVCLGAQLLASALGAELTRGGELELGIGEVTLTAVGRKDPVLGGEVAGRGGDGAALPESEGARPGGEGAGPGGEGAVLPVFHWHRDTFTVPPGAVGLASSDRYDHQAFRVGRCTYGLQFHLELDRELARSMAAHLPDGIEIDERRRVAIEEVGRPTFLRFFEVATSGP